MMWVWQCSPSSTMIQRRPILWATAPVVPEPAKESRTRSPGLVAISNNSLKSRSGFGVANDIVAEKASDLVLCLLIIANFVCSHNVRRNKLSDFR